MRPKRIMLPDYTTERCFTYSSIILEPHPRIELRSDDYKSTVIAIILEGQNLYANKSLTNLLAIVPSYLPKYSDFNLPIITPIDLGDFLGNSEIKLFIISVN